MLRHLLLICLILCACPATLSAAEPAAAPTAPEASASASGKAASAADSTAAPESQPAPPVVSAAASTDPEEYWQAEDWQAHGETTKVGEQVTLLHKSEQGFRLGLAVLLPDWQQVADLLPLSQRLNALGFDTLIMLPSPRQLTLDPNAEQDQLAIQAFRESWQLRLTALMENNSGSGGYTLLVAAGSSAAWLGGLLSSQTLAAPDGLVLIDAFYPATDANQILARDIAGLPCPVLDLYRSGQVSWLDQAVRERALAVKRQNKLDWRQLALQTRDERGDQLAGWLNFLGWK